MESLFFEEVAALEKENQTFAIAHIVSTQGSTPRNRGRMLIRKDGSFLGTVGGGPMELFVQEQASEAIRLGEARMVQKQLVEEGENAAGMICGGVMEVFIDVVKSRPQLILIGGGHVNLALAKNAILLGYDLTLVEDRPEFATKERFPMVRKIVCEENLVQSLSKLEIDSETRILIATKDHDIEVLLGLIHSDATYIGMLGSKRKVAKAHAKLRKAGVSAKKLQVLHSPVGLDIGAETPAEIAVSILAELIRTETGHSGDQLRNFVDKLVLIRGAGDLGTGAAVRLYNSGFKVICLDTHQPSHVRQSVCFAQAIYSKVHEVEGVVAERADSIEEIYRILEEGRVPVFVDPAAKSVAVLKPVVVLDAVLAKKNTGLHKEMAPLTLAMGPGFSAGEDCHMVIETARGHNLGAIIHKGTALPDTGIPGSVEGYGVERVLRSPCKGVFQPIKEIGTLVKKGDMIATVGNENITSPFDGMLRGLLNKNLVVQAGAKVGDVDPRGRGIDFHAISDKARAVAGGVLEAVLSKRE